jgi:1-deoxy-D-xylulose-5-phosphate reductoisomerase
MKGGNRPAVMNAANEIAVYGFLHNRIGFLEMTEVVEKTIHRVAHIDRPSLEEYFESDAEARNFAASLLHL